MDFSFFFFFFSFFFSPGSDHFRHEVWVTLWFVIVLCVCAFFWGGYILRSMYATHMDFSWPTHLSEKLRRGSTIWAWVKNRAPNGALVNANKDIQTGGPILGFLSFDPYPTGG